MGGLGRFILTAAALGALAAAPAAAVEPWRIAGGVVIPDETFWEGSSLAAGLELDLPFDDGKIAAVLTDVSESPLGITSVRARIPGRVGGFLIACRTPTGAVAAMLQPGDGTVLRLVPQVGGYALEPAPAEPPGSCAGGIDPSSLPDLESAPGKTAPRRDKAPGLPAADDGSRQDIMIAYTPRTETVMGGWDQVRAEAQLAVDEANWTYVNSGYGGYLRLVHITPTTYDENTAWNYEDHVTALYLPNDGKMDELPPLRDLVGADFLCLLIDGADALGNVYQCGAAPVMQPDDLGGDFAHLALSVVSIQCAASAWTLAHEVGHNRGCAHNREDVSVHGAYPYAYGHRFQAGGSGYRTVMAYDNASGDFTRVPYFSNPGVDYLGTPTGVPIGQAGESHNAQVHQNTSAQCAAFRVERTFLDFDWAGPQTGFLLFPYSTWASAFAGSEDGGAIVFQSGDPGFTGTYSQPRTFVHGGAGSAVLGGN